MNQQLTISLPEQTINKIYKIANDDNFNLFIERAINFYLTEMEKKNLVNELKEGAMLRAERDLKLANEWFNLEEEAWINHQE